MSNLNRMIKMEITFYNFMLQLYIRELIFTEYYLNNADNFLLKILIRENWTYLHFLMWTTFFSFLPLISDSLTFT